MGLLPEIRRNKKLDDDIALVQTNLDNTPKKFGAGILIASNSTGSPYVSASYVAPTDGIVVFKALSTSSESAGSRWQMEIDSGGGFNSVAYCFSTGHANAQFWNSGGAATGMSAVVRAGETVRYQKLNFSGSQNASDELVFYPFEA